MPFKIIGINPGWRYLGIVVFDESGLRDWRLKCVPGKGLRAKTKKMREVLSRFIDRYAPTVLSIKKHHSSRISANLKLMASNIEADCRKNGMRVCSYSIKELESLISPERRINKKELAELLASEYPVLSRELEREKRSRNPYHLRLFEAVALGHVCFTKYSKRQNEQDLYLSDKHDKQRP